AVEVRNKTEPGLYGDGAGLYLQIGPRRHPTDNHGPKSWLFIYKVAGKRRDMGLGPTYTVSLAEARDKARHCRQLRLDGKDPLDERERERAAARATAAKIMLFRECAEACIKSHLPEWKNVKHAAQWTSTLE